MGIELSSVITLGDVDLGKVTDTSNLNIVLGLDEMHALERSVRDDASSTARLGAPRNRLTLGVSDSTHVRGSPEAEVVNVVDPDGLAHGRLGRSSTALVGAGLTDLGGLGRIGREVAGVPALVGVTAAARPQLDVVAVVQVAVGEVHALSYKSNGINKKNKHK